MPKTAPATGAPITEPNPPLRPAINITRRSSRDNRSVRASQSASAPPIWTAVPTLATEPPKSRVTTGAMNPSGAIRSGTSRRFRWTSSINRLFPRAVAAPKVA